jgi:hypothetical protein
MLVYNNPSLYTQTSENKKENTTQKVTNQPTMTSMNRNVQHLTQPVHKQKLVL